MASVVSTLSCGFTYRKPTASSSMEGLKRNCLFSSVDFTVRKSDEKRVVTVRAEVVNPEIRKTEDKVVDSVSVDELSKPLTAYCRCWRSATFPLCDGSHVKHNKATGDNVGPLLLKKPKQ